jgi:hypothetical protein
MAKRKRRDPYKEFVISNLAQGAAEVSKKLTEHLRPIYIANSANEPELIGTGVLIAVGSHRFLVTAAHVFAQAGGVTFYIPNDASGDLQVLKGQRASSVSNQLRHKDDVIDIAVVWLDTSLASQFKPSAFVSTANINLDDTGDPTRVYIAMGYPWRKNQKINRVTRRLRASIHAYAANILPFNDLAAAGLQPGSHMMLRYQKRHSRTQDGRDVTAPHPHGMSGGPLWRFDPYGAASDITHLVGILIEWKHSEGGLLAVRMPVVFAAMSCLCPEVADLLPSANSIKVEILPVSNPS